MKKRLSHVLLIALLLGSHAPASRAQKPEEGPSSKKAEAEREAARAELERKALGLLEEALAEAAGLKLVENRVRAQLTAARLLWPRDARAAREAFDAAAAGVAALMAEVNPEDNQFYNAAQIVMQLRGEMLQIAGQHDAKLALDFMRATRPGYADALAAAGYGQQELTLELTLAGQVAAQEPRRALEMAEESLSRGVTMALLNVLNGLSAKDPAAAAKLASAIAKRLRVEEMQGSYESSGVAQQLLQMSRPAESPQPANSVGQGAAVVSVRAPAPAGGVALLDEQTRKELVEKVLTAAMSGGTNQPGGYGLFQALQFLLPEVERYAPARAAAMRRRAEEFERGFNPQGHVMRRYEEVMQKGTAEAVLEAAAKAPAEARDMLYLHAAWKVFNEGADAERARQILDNVSNPQQRTQARRSMELQSYLREAEQGRYAEARQAAARIAAPEEKVSALLQFAAQALAKGDKQAARPMLDEARAVVEGQTRGQQQFIHRLQVAHAYAQVDAAASFEVVESAIGRLDQLLDAAAEVDGFGQELFKDGELKSLNGYLWNDLIHRCAHALTTLAETDFERASAAVKKLRRADARAMAQLALASNLLNADARGRRTRHREMPPLQHSDLRNY